MIIIEYHQARNQYDSFAQEFHQVSSEILNEMLNIDNHLEGNIPNLVANTLPAVAPFTNMFQL